MFSFLCYTRKGGRTMRIGIDIDGTLTDIKSELDLAAKLYAQKLGKEISFLSKKRKKNSTKNIYQELFNFSEEELKYFLGPIQEKITNVAKPRVFCVENINKLYAQGHYICIITARDSRYHKNPYLQSKFWLDKYNINYHKIIVNARDKAKICLEEKIDLLIDDNKNNCLQMCNMEKKAICIGEKMNLNNKVKELENWNQIYDWIKKENL